MEFAVWPWLNSQNTVAADIVANIKLCLAAYLRRIVHYSYMTEPSLCGNRLYCLFIRILIGSTHAHSPNTHTNIYYIFGIDSTFFNFGAMVSVDDLPRCLHCTGTNPRTGETMHVHVHVLMENVPKRTRLNCELKAIQYRRRTDMTTPPRQTKKKWNCVCVMFTRSSRF